VSNGKWKSCWLTLLGRTAVWKGQQYARQFAQEMWQKCGMRVVIMGAWLDESKEVMVGM